MSLKKPVNVFEIAGFFYIGYSSCVSGKESLHCALNLLLCEDGRVVRWCWVNFQCRGVLLIWIIVWQGPTALAVGAGGGCLDIFSLVYHFFFFSFSLSLGDGPI